MTIHDNNGTPIHAGDVVKVYHFTGARRKKHYMYKQAMGLHTWSDGSLSMRFSHLDMGSTCDYYEHDEVLKWYEIVQSVACDHEERPRLK